MSDWGKVPREVFMDKRLTRLDIQVLGILCAHANGKTGICTRRQEAIAAEVDAKRESVNRSLKKLGNLGYVEARARAGMKRSLEYRVLFTQGAPGQLGLFDVNEAPRAAKAKAPAKPRIRDREITSDVTPEITSVVTLDVTSNEQTPVNRGCAAAPAAPANDDRPAEVIEEAGAVPLRRPPQPAAEPAAQVPSWTRAQTDALGARLRDAAGASINAASPGFLVLAEPIGWLAAGCDLELDVLPAVAGLAARSRGSPIRSWSYFAGAVREARDRRVEMAKPVGASISDDPRSTARGGEHAQRSRGQKGDRAGAGRRSSADRFSDALRDAFSDVYGPEDA